MVDSELQGLHAAVLVHQRRVNRPYPRRHGFGLLKADALNKERAALQRELEMLVPYYALRRDLELVAEARRRKALSPPSSAHGGMSAASAVDDAV